MLASGLIARHNKEPKLLVGQTLMNKRNSKVGNHRLDYVATIYFLRDKEGRIIAKVGERPAYLLFDIRKPRTYFAWLGSNPRERETVGEAIMRIGDRVKDVHSIVEVTGRVSRSPSNATTEIYYVHEDFSLVEWARKQRL